jgi:hypothetical protein
MRPVGVTQINEVPFLFLGFLHDLRRSSRLNLGGIVGITPPHESRYLLPLFLACRPLLVSIDPANANADEIHFSHASEGV